MYNRRMRYHFSLLILLFILTACGRKTTPTPGIDINDAIATSLASLPTSMPSPIPSPRPTPTAFDLRGLFCEYQFCVGHPVDMAFFDVGAQQNTGSPSTYSQGIIASYNANLFIQVMWQISPGSADPGFMLDLIVDEGLDARVGTASVKLIRDMNVVYIPITSTASPVLPFGGAAAWTCGDRVFAWKIYTPDEASPPGLFESAFARFTCNR
jgi:hypothetical protein